MTDIDQQITNKPSKRICAIDLGTNSFHGIIVDIYPDGSFRTVDQIKEMVRFGRRGVGVPLDKETMDAGIDALRKISLLAEHQQCERILAFATSAIREAPNGGDFIQRSIDELQLKIRAIPGKVEAELIGYAVQHGMALGSEPVLVMDIGGGSTECLILTNESFLFLDSYKMGVSRMTADFVKNDPITKNEIKALQDYYKKQTEHLRKIFLKHESDTLIGSSGTMQNIGAMVAKMNGESPDITLNEYEYSAEDFKKFYKKFVKLNREERLKTPGLDEKRVDFIVAGLVLVDTIISETKITRIRTSTQALREGIILRFIKKEMSDLHLLADYPDTRKRSVYELLTKCDWRETHSTHVSRLAVKLFDETMDIHQLNETDRELLEYASLLHDIGYHISHKKHHKHSLYIIQNSDLKGFKEEEIQIMAHVARYHRRSTPKARHELYSRLSSETQQKIKKLSGILRVADGLDRSHFQNVKDIHVKMKSNKCVIYLDTQIDPSLEIWGANRKKELFEEMMGKSLKIKKSKQLKSK